MNNPISFIFCQFGTILLPLLLAFLGTAAQAQVQSPFSTLQANSGKFIYSTNNGLAAAAEKPPVPDTDKWLIEQVQTPQGLKVTLRSSFGKWMSAQPDGSLTVNRDGVGDWERFAVESRPNGFFLFKTAHGTYLTAEIDGSIVAKSKAISGLALLKINPISLLAGSANAALQRKCGENEVCNLGMIPGGVVAYGAGTQWLSKVVNGPFRCDNATFSDPASGMVKECRSAALTDIKYCANENQQCVLPTGGTFAVVYGAGSKWVAIAFPNLEGAVPCNSARFGGDPAPGAAKACGVALITNDAPKRMLPPTGRFNQAQLDIAVAWMIKEFTLYETPVCWTSRYDRGNGIAPQGCSGGKSLENLRCYDNCRSGYVSDGATTCASVCPSGYKASGIATCTWDESNGGKSYVPDPAYDQGEQCSRWDDWGTFQTCGATSRKACKAGEHREGLNCRKDCRAGYKETAGVCYLDKPWDVSRNTYTRGSGTVQDACLSNRKFEDGLCYQIATAGYSCKVATCNQNCPSGLQACGSAAACGKDEESCATAITDMAVSPALMVAGAFTGGGLKVAGSAGKVAAKQASKTLKAALENAGKANDVKDAAFILKSAVENLQKIGETDIAALSNQEIASEIESHYKSGSDEYKAIGRRWAQVVAAINARIFQIELHKFVSGMADESGILGTIYAFDKPKCGDHVPFPR